MAITEANRHHGLKAAQKLAGHASDKITKRVYIRETEKRKPLK